MVGTSPAISGRGCDGFAAGTPAVLLPLAQPNHSAVKEILDFTLVRSLARLMRSIPRAAAPRAATWRGFMHSKLLAAIFAAAAFVGPALAAHADDAVRIGYQTN